MSTPESPEKEQRNEDYTATDSGEAESDFPPPLEDIHSEDEDAPDQPILIAAEDEDLHLWAEVKREVDPNLTTADFHEFLDFCDELNFFDADELSIINHNFILLNILLTNLRLL